jgi:hypothetical protein
LQIKTKLRKTLTAKAFLTIGMVVSQLIKNLIEMHSNR